MAKFNERRGAYASGKTLTKDDGRFDAAGNPKNSRPQNHAAEVERASGRTKDSVSKAGMADGLAAALPRGTSFGGGAVTRVVGPRRVVK